MRRINEIDLLFFWGNLRKHYLGVFTVGAACAVVTLLVCLFMVTPTYQAEISLFAWGNSKFSDNGPRETRPAPRNESGTLGGMTYEDVMFGTQLVNDYQELLRSRYVNRKVQEKLNEELPELKQVPVQFQSLVQQKTRFIRVSAYSHSREKAKRAVQIIADVFINSVRDLMKIERVQVVDAPMILGIVSPKTTLLTILAFLAGAGATLGIFCLIDFLHYTLRNADVVKAELDLPVIGLIGQYPDKQRNANLACLPSNAKNYQFNYIVEDFLLLQTNLQYSLPQASKAQILVITSAFPKDGKSFISLNLALTLSGNGKRVLLINCDLRKPEYDYLKLPRQPGLVNLILGENSLEQVVHRNVMGTNLSVIRSGPVPPNPTRLLEMFQSSGNLEKLAREYDYIVLDSPPCFNMADPLLLGKSADGVIIVANSRRTPVEAVRQVKEQLLKLGVNILGVVLNHYSVQSAGYGYGYGYGTGPENKNQEK